MYWILCGFALLMLASLSASRRMRGARGERAVAAVLRKLPSSYRVFHNVTLPAGAGTSQIDHLVISPFGVLVIETKALQGRISGREDSREWVQHLGRKSFPFLNPIEQNRGHVLAISRGLDIEPEEVLDIVVFTGDARPSHPVGRVLWHPKRLFGFFEQWDKVVFSDNEVEQLVARLDRVRLPDTAATDRRHRRYVGARKAKRAPKGPRCVCGDVMVSRVNGKTSEEFLGCRSYPVCAKTRPMPG